MARAGDIGEAELDLTVTQASSSDEGEDRGDKMLSSVDKYRLQLEVGHNRSYCYKKTNLIV